MANPIDSLTDTQLLILNNAASHENRSILPHAKSMKSFGAALNKALKGLVDNGWLKRDDHIGHGEASMKDEKGAHTFRITKAGLKLIHEEDDEVAKGPKKVTEEQNAKAEKADAIADKAKEGLEADNPGIMDKAEKAIEKEFTIDHSFPQEGDTAEKTAQRALLKTKQDFINAKSEEAEALAVELKEKTELLKDLNKQVRETQKDAANVIYSITGVKPKILGPGRPKATRAPGDKAVGRTPSVSVRGKRITIIKADAAVRDGSLRSTAWEIIKAQDGLTYEEYKKAGGREGDLKFFVMKDFVKVTFPAAASEKTEAPTESEAAPETESESAAA